MPSPDRRYREGEGIIPSSARKGGREWAAVRFARVEVKVVYSA
jgi:hypothetical protein